MTEPGDRSDSELISLLRDGLQQSDPVPDDVTGFAKAAFGWRQIDAELAALTFDSEVATPAAVRSSATTRMVSFEVGEWTIEMEYDPAANRLLGQVTPETQLSVELHTSAEPKRTDSDARGRFDFEDITPGPTSLVLRTAGDEQVVKTEWFVL